MNTAKELKSNLNEANNKFDAFIITLALEEEQKIQLFHESKLEKILSQNTGYFEVTAQSEELNEISLQFDIEGTNMMICDSRSNKFTIRNR